MEDEETTFTLQENVLKKDLSPSWFLNLNLNKVVIFLRKFLLKHILAGKKIFFAKKSHPRKANLPIVGNIK